MKLSFNRLAEKSDDTFGMIIVTIAVFEFQCNHTTVVELNYAFGSHKALDPSSVRSSFRCECIFGCTPGPNNNINYLLLSLHHREGVVFGCEAFDLSSDP
jgi:hypothetical protein